MPNCETIDLMKYLPRYWHEIKEMQALQNALGKEVSELQCVVASTLDQMFVSTATWGLKLWEKELAIETNKTLSDEFRREIIMAKMRGTATTTKALIKSVAVAFSNGEVEVIEDNAKYTVKIKFVGTRGVPANLEDFKKMLSQIIPAHLVIEYVFTYMTWKEFNSYDKTWKQWEDLRLNWKEFTEYRE